MFDQILTFYDAEKRDFPWRTVPANPYFVYVSEIMLQQTTTTTVRDYFLRFTKQFPTLVDLAKSDIGAIFLLWQGLGYYSRGRNLHTAAKLMLDQGGIPRHYDQLIALPGIGDYTAKAVLAIAFNEPVLPIDGNIKRVFARYFGLDVPYEQLHTTIEKMDFDFQGRPGDICQGLMDFANIICLPKNQKCTQCPLQQSCQAYLSNKTAILPRPKKKILKKPMLKDGLVCIKDGCIGLNLHKSGTLLGGLWNIPMVESASVFPDGVQTKQIIRHIFTHIDLRLTLRFVEDVECDEFVSLSNLLDYPLSRLTRKVLALLDANHGGAQKFTMHGVS
ncbi:MAG: A/G-specific adenine glycosylase [Pseudomonadota bacterium]